ncbi:MAG: hypothetical protein MJA29_09345 [Candidatus Omnitrophica bacterium]|nr:hypothetical protein [Candidatus Omnitrophota bacterium]
MIVGIDIPDLRHPEGVDAILSEHEESVCEDLNREDGLTHITYYACKHAWMAYREAVE